MKHIDLRSAAGPLAALAALAALVAAITLCACSRPAHEPTPEGQVLTAWSAPPPTKDIGPSVTQELTSPAGTKYRVEARMGMAGDKRVPVNVRIELLGNPTRADIDVRCATPMQFATDPADVFSTSCRAFERTGSKSLVGTRLRQQAVTLRILGDSRILLETDGPAPSAP